MMSITVSALLAQPLIDKADQKFSNVTSLKVEAIFCDVIITGGNSDEINFKGEVYSEANIKIKYEQKGSSLRVWLECPKILKGNNKGHFVFTLPVNTSLDIETVSGNLTTSNMGKATFGFSTVSGDVKINNIASSVGVRTVSGDQTCNDINGNITSKAVSGDISIKNVSGNSDVTTTSGTVNISGAGNDIKIKTVSGRVTTSNTNGKSAISTTSGSVNINQASGAINIKTVSGSIRGSVVTFTGSSTFHTTSGSINIASTNSPEQLKFNLSSTSGSLSAKGNTGRKNLITGNGAIEITGKTVSGSQTYN